MVILVVMVVLLNWDLDCDLHCCYVSIMARVMVMVVMMMGVNGDSVVGLCDGWSGLRLKLWLISPASHLLQVVRTCLAPLLSSRHEALNLNHPFHPCLTCRGAESEMLGSDNV